MRRCPGWRRPPRCAPPRPIRDRARRRSRSVASALSCVSEIAGEVAGPGRAEADLVRVSLGVGDELGERLVGQLGVDDEHQRRPLHDQPDHGEIVDRAVGHRDVVQVLRVGERIGEQRVAVRRRARGKGAADHARAAGLVLDHDGLADPLLHQRRRQAGRHVGQSARRERHDEGDRPLRIGLGLRRRRARPCRGQGCPPAPGRIAGEMSWGSSCCCSAVHARAEAGKRRDSDVGDRHGPQAIELEHRCQTAPTNQCERQTCRRSRRFGRLPSPLWGGVGGGGRSCWTRLERQLRPPPARCARDPPHKGEGRSALHGRSIATTRVGGADVRSRFEPSAEPQTPSLPRADVRRMMTPTQTLPGRII